MAVIKTEEIFLYVSEAVSNPAENIQAITFMEQGNIPFVKLMYNDPTAHEQNFAALNSWWKDRLPPVDSFPFLVYTEVHDDIPARMSPVKYLKGLDAIKTIVDIYKA